MSRSDHSRTFRPKRQLLDEYDHNRRGQTRAARRDVRDGGARGAIEAALADMAEIDSFTQSCANEPEVTECSDLHDEPEVEWIECLHCGGSVPLHGICVFCFEF